MRVVEDIALHQDLMYLIPLQKVYCVKQSMREQAFLQKFSFQSIFDSIANGNGAPFEDTFMFYVDVSYRMSH